MKNTNQNPTELKTKLYLRKKVNSIEDLPENLRNLPKLVEQHTTPIYYPSCNISESLFKFGKRTCIWDKDLELLIEIGYDIEII